MPLLSRIAGLALLALGAAVSIMPAAAQSTASRPMKFIVPFGPGGSGDTIARLIGQHLSERTGQTVVVENRMGAGGNIGADAVAKSDPDGTTLLMAANYLAMSPSLYTKMSYDPMKDLAPVTMVGDVPMVVVVNLSVPAQSIKELVALAKSKPGELAYATPGHGTSTHLASELFKQQAGIDMRHVPYRANPLAMNDVIAGHVPLLLDFVSTGAPHVRSGAVRALGTTGPKRAKVLPDVPTMMETGINNFQTQAWFAIFAPGGTPKDVIDKLNTEIAAVLAMAAVQERLDALGIELTVGGPDQLTALIKTDLATWGPVVAKSGMAKE